MICRHKNEESSKIIAMLRKENVKKKTMKNINIFCQAKRVLCEWIKLNQVNYAWIVFLAFYFLGRNKVFCCPAIQL